MMAMKPERSDSSDCLLLADHRTCQSSGKHGAESPPELRIRSSYGLPLPGLHVDSTRLLPESHSHETRCHTHTHRQSDHGVA
jgi:hypothetical protein